MLIHVGSKNPVKVVAVRNVFERVFRDQPIEVIAYEVASGVADQPFEDEIAKGAIQRATSALRDADYGVGIEAGLIWQKELKIYLDVQFCAIIDSLGKITLGHGSGFQYPPEIIREVGVGKSVGEAMGALTKINDIGQQMGAIGYLCHELLNRTELTEQAVLVALIPRIRKELYEDS
jgi:inosine/xanthosine triphosphatase